MKECIAVAAAGLLASCGNAPPPQIAITIDDLPVHAPYPGLTPLEVNRQMIVALKTAGVPATAFVNAVNVKDPPLWKRCAGLARGRICPGNHTWSHRHLSEMSIEQFEEELTKDELRPEQARRQIRLALVPVSVP
jgi:peptidoglycan/xylan/chitin deacetylase (PgdA/CDA1 family)